MGHSNVIFEGHKGILDNSTNEVLFYGLLFRDMVVASRYLKKLHPDDYVPWEYNGYTGLVLGSMYFYDGIWYNEAAFKELLGIEN